MLWSSYDKSCDQWKLPMSLSWQVFQNSACSRRIELPVAAFFLTVFKSFATIMASRKSLVEAKLLNADFSCLSESRLIL